MATIIGIGHSQNPEPQEAAFEAGLMVRRQMGETDVDFLLLLATADYCQPTTLAAIRSVITTKNLIGTSTAGIILPNQILNRGLAILAIKSDLIHFTSSCMAINVGSNLRSIGFELAHNLSKELPPTSHRQGCLLLGDAFYRNSQDFLNGAGEVLGINSPLIAGISSTNSSHSKKNYQFFNNQLLESHVVGMVMSGSSRLVVESSHGFKLLGRPRIATKTNEHVLRTIDDKPAIQLYEDFLKETSENIQKDPLKPHQLYPLGVWEEKTNRYVLRNPVDILADGSIVFHGEIPQGAQVHVMLSNKDACMQSALNAAQLLKEVLGEKQADLVLIMESVTRAKILGRLAQNEIVNIRETIGFNSPVFGFYTNGEIAPWIVSGGIKHLSLNNGGLVLAGIL